MIEGAISRLRERHGQRMSEHDDDVMNLIGVFEKALTPTDDEREALDYAIRCAIPNDLDYRPLWKMIRAIQDAVLAAGFRRSEVPSTECPYCGHLLHALNGGPCGVILSDVLGEVRYCQCERSKNEHITEGRIWKLLAESVQGEKVGTTIPVPVEDIRTLLARRSEVPEPSAEGPAFIAIMPPSPETSKRWYSMYCRVCGIEEMMADTADDPRLVARRDAHNRERHAEPQGEPSDAQVEAAITPTNDEREVLADLAAPFFDRAVDYDDGARDEEGLADAILAAGFRRSVVPEPRVLRDAWHWTPEVIRAALRAAAVTNEPSREALLAQGFTEGVNFIDNQPGAWGAGMVTGRAEAARRRAAVQGENRDDND